MQKVLIFKKVFTSWIRTRGLLNASQLLYPLSYKAVVFDGMLLKFSLLLLQTAAECKLITTLTRSDNHEAEGWWINNVRQLMCQCWKSQASYRHDRQTDGRTDRISLFYKRYPIFALYLSARWRRPQTTKFYPEEVLTKFLIQYIQNCRYNWWTCLHICMYIYLFVFPHPHELTVK